MADLYNMCNGVEGIMTLGRCVGTTVPILWPSVLLTVFAVTMIASMRTFNMNLPKSLLVSMILLWSLSAGFFAGQWVNEVWMAAVTVALAASAVYTYHENS